MIARLLAAALPLLVASLPAAAQTVAFVYTTFDSKSCKHTKGRAEEDYGSWLCAGLGNIPVRLAAGDQRMSVTFGPLTKDNRAASQTLPGFNDVYSGTVEWRIEKRGGKPHPFATILRWNVVTGEDRDKATGPIKPSGRVLVVTRLGPGGTCHVGYVDARANPDANALARKIADEHARTFDCAKDKPLMSGKVPDPNLMPGDQTSAPLTVRQVAMAKGGAATCLLQVEGKTYISGTCDASIIDDEGSFILTEKARAPYFAYVIIDPDDKTTADGSWNKVRSATHADAPLGNRVLRLKDGCWSNESAKVCWSKK